ncbi:alpha-galactosidase [Uliginosibacterium gangwonense]|uniref:alpha-galactosidase n=1 Tax=Uliginosibacterium gangwonense TaxID=392736 RepID=UPI00036F5FEE|nr:alpha-galactosidase [Uliginosibacterium gangwonense]
MYTHAPESGTDYLILHGCHTTVVLEYRPHEAPLWRYWGPRLPEGCAPLAPLRDGRAFPPATMDVDQPLSIAPCFGGAWFGQSALLAHRAGQQFEQAFDQCRIEWAQPGRSLILHLEDTVAQLGLDIHLALDEHDVLRLHSSLHNRGVDVLDVQWLAAGTLVLPGHAQQVRSFFGQWANEFQVQHDPLSHDIWLRENRRGRTSHDTFPGAVVMLPGATEHAGTAFGAHLAWSGNHRQLIERLHDALFQWQLGEWLAPGEVRLEPGETLDTPVLVASCSTAGLNGLAANFHAAVRAALPWPGGTMRPRPIHINTWEAMYFDHRPDELRALAEAASEIGVERFVLDDGWFHGRHHDRAALGDWWPDEGKYPDGLLPLAQYVQSLGMEFGLWLEPEMVNPDSELFRTHPDWALQIEGRPLHTMRNQLVLDVSRGEVADYLFERIDALLNEIPIAYIKWDMNRDLAHAGDANARPAYRRFVQAVYALLDRVRASHPAVEIESCASGGGRIDMGILAHTHRVWTSDCNDALSRVGIQRGALQFIPPEIMGAHIGPAPAHTTGRSQNLDFRAAVALPGHLGIEMDVRHLDRTQRNALKCWLDLYKCWRERLHHGQVWLGELGDNVVWQAHGGTRDLIVFVYRTAPTTCRYTPPLRLPMLEHDLEYRIQRLDPPAPEWTSSPLNNTLLAAGRGETPPLQGHGAWLAEAGLPLPRMLAESCAIYRIEAMHSAS